MIEINIIIAIGENMIKSINKIKAIIKEDKRRIITKSTKGIEKWMLNFIELQIVLKNYKTRVLERKLELNSKNYLMEIKDDYKLGDLSLNTAKFLYDR